MLKKRLAQVRGSTLDVLDLLLTDIAVIGWDDCFHYWRPTLENFGKKNRVQLSLVFLDDWSAKLISCTDYDEALPIYARD